MPNRAPLKPRLACEITHRHVIAARGARKGSGVETYTVRRIDEGALAPAVTQANIADRESLRTAISAALTPLAGRTKDIVAIVPDAAIHVLLLDFDDLAERESEAMPLVRFRLKKALPFDVETAAISFQRWRDGKTVKVLAAVMPAAVRDEYEEVFRAAGYLPGVLLSSTLATLAAVDATVPTLLVKGDGPSITMAIADHGELLLYRSLEMPAGRELTSHEIADAVHPSIVFYEDTFQKHIERIVLAGDLSVSEIRTALGDQSTARFEEFSSTAPLGDSLSGDRLPAPRLSGIVGALA